MTRATKIIRYCHHISAATLILIAAPALAEDPALKVVVNNVTYVVNGETVSGQTGTEPLDATTLDKARFTARVLDQQILNSDFNKQLFDPVYRAVVFSDQSSGRLSEPWRRLLRSNSDKSLALAKEQFKVWATKLAIDPNELMLAVARKDYLDGVGAFRENAAIYRNITKRNQPLTYDDALRLMRNAWPVIRLAYARGLEERLSGNAAATNKSAEVAQAAGDRFAQRVQAEVINLVDNDVKNAADLYRLYANVVRIAEADSIQARSYHDSIRPPITRFAAYQPQTGAVLPQGGSGSSTIVATPPLTNPTGGTLASPYTSANAASSATAPAATPGLASPTSAQASQITSASPNSVGTSNPNASTSATGDLGPAQTSPGQSHTQGPANGSDDNLKTYSSKGYHAADGFVFNPRTGLWQSQTDPNQTRIPAVITCCDETGLAFPSDAVEAQQDYEWNEAGVDPNCGKLYGGGVTCGPEAQTSTGDTFKPDGPTDKDNDIWQALVFLDKHFPPDQKGPAISLFLNGLPPAYQNRATQILRQYNASHSAPNASPAPLPSRAANLPLNQVGRSTPNQSTITGLGGVSSHYEPITKTAAQSIIAKYGTLPGGIGLEGDSPDLSFIKTVAYVAKANAFILNDDVIYLNPVTPGEFSEIASALAADDKLGVSLDKFARVFGKLSPESNVTWNLRLADRFLGQIGFGKIGFTGSGESLVGYNWTAGHSDNARGGSGYAHIVFNFHDYRFAEDDSGQLNRSDMRLDSTLVPSSGKLSDDGRYLPDYDRISRGDVDAAYVATLKDLQDNIAYYARERIMRIAIAYGEAAAFVRSTRARGITLDLR